MTAPERPVLIMAGGTGGHVFPGIAVARQFKRLGVPVVWLGTRRGLEAQLVPQEGIDIEWLDVAGLRGKGIVRMLSAPLMLARALCQARGVLRRLRPRLAVGMGGFVSGPGGVMARVLRVPLLIHEQNAVAGMTNRFLARIATRVFEAFPGSFPCGRHAVAVGNPVREEIMAIGDPAQRFAGRGGPLRLLVVGGSQGARALNETVPAALSGMPRRIRPRVRHQAGTSMIDAARDSYRTAGVGADVTAFIDSMAEAYAWADLVICRSGALTVSELAAAGIGSVLVPFPYAVDDHQTANARMLEDCGAAVVVQQSGLSPESLRDLLTELSGDRERLRDMAVAARGAGFTDAASRLVEEGLRYARID